MLSRIVLVSLCACASAQRSLIMTADPGSYSGISEGHYILSNMTNVHNITSELPLCALAMEGQLKGKDMVLVTTGIGTNNAALCSVSVVNYYKGKEKLTDAIYLGTSGWTPKNGGFFNPEKDPVCSAPQQPAAEQLNNIGDVCISSASFQLRCGFCQWDDFANAECTAPQCSGRDSEDVFGKCTFVSPTNTISEKLIAASQEAQYQPRNAKLSAYIQKYWTDMWRGLGVPPVYPPTTPRVHGFSRCAEAADYNLWTGMPQDFLCRKYLASVISNATGVATSPEEVTCVSAMEGPGWMQALLEEANGSPIPFANIRGNSDYDFWPLMRDESRLLMNLSWVDDAAKNDFITEGYMYAVGTMSSIVLKYYELRA
eukprot:TRINITY_DN8976_c0_g1_i3.p1 TRINITY_DN8976_c0_g1~~TRINITY_DN8976_c0_g1_i3.p1  ORF type:complete len:371 (+),score=70.57 TRINITY_DN8976_c0_g1_i3:1667-2779(+)